MMLAEYFDATRTLDIGGCFDRLDINTDNIDYSSYGINYDRTLVANQKACLIYFFIEILYFTAKIHIDGNNR